jgi:hypothetical protein
MARTFGSATDKVNHGSPANLDDQATLTVMGWFYPTTIDGATFRMVGGKGVNNFYTLDNSAGNGGSGSMRCRIVHATTNLDYYTTTGIVTVNTWQFLAYCVDTGASATNRVKLYRGTLSVLATNQAAVTTQEPVGGRTSDAGSDWHTGNVLDAFPLVGRCANIMLFNRTLTEGEVQAQQFWPHVETGCQLWSEYYGQSTEPDWSGQTNNGTVTGTSVSDHVPVALPWVQSDMWRYIVPPPAAGGWNPLLSHTRNRLLSGVA